MATGDTADFLFRLRSLLPPRWFPTTAPGAVTSTPVLDGVLSAPAAGFAYIYSLIAYARAQMRMATATGIGLDMIAVDYFGLGLPRKSNESDIAYLRRIKAELLRPRATRAAVIKALTDLTGRTPRVFEPARATDTGGYGNTGMTAGTGLGYGLAGGYGSLLLPFQAFVTAFRPSGGGVANVGGYYAGSGWAGGGYGVGAIEYAGASMIAAAVSDADIYATTAKTMPAAATAWTQISS